jgi:hypothetical protein
MSEMNKFVGCYIIDTADKDGVWIHQPKLLKILKVIFKDLIEESARVFKTPSAPKTLIITHPLISPEKQKQFRIGVGMLLYLGKHYHPDISNSVRKLSKVADGAIEGHFKALLRTIKFVMGTGDYSQSLILMPSIWKEYSGDPDTRISVYGYVLYFCGAPIA